MLTSLVLTCTAVSYFTLAIVLYLVFRSPLVSLLLASIRVAILIWSMSLVASDTVPADSLHYFSVSASLYEARVPLGEQFLFTGHHILYYLSNQLSFQLFGLNPFSPLILNLIYSLIGFHLLSRSLSDLKLTPYRFSFSFFLLSPELLCWTGFYNLKESLLFCLLSLLIFTTSRLYLGRSTSLWLISSILALSLLFFMRFYIPILLLLSLLAAYSYYQLRVFTTSATITIQRLLLLLLIILVSAYAVVYLGRLPTIDLYHSWQSFSPSFSLAPTFEILKPLSLFSSKYDAQSPLLALASLTNLLLLPLALYTLYYIRHFFSSMYFLWLFLFFLASIFLFFFFPDISGRRQLFSLAPLFLSLQAIGLYQLLTNKSYRRNTFA